MPGALENNFSILQIVSHKIAASKIGFALVRKTVRIAEAISVKYYGKLQLNTGL